MNNFLETMQVMIRNNHVDAFVFRKDIQTGSLIILVTPSFRSGYVPASKYFGTSFVDAALKYQGQLSNCDSESQFDNYLTNIGILK